MKMEEQVLKMKTIIRNKIYQAIAIGNFETDESINEIYFKDICSDNDSAYLNDPDGDSGAGTPDNNIDMKSADKTKRQMRRHKNKRAQKDNADRHKNISSHLIDEASNYTTALEHYNNLKKKKELTLAADDNPEASQFMKKMNEEKKPR